MVLIKHLVLSGGGQTLFQTLGAYQHLESHNYVCRTNLESIYATSAGSIVGTLICLNEDWNVVNDYMLNRPWHHVFNINLNNLLRIYNNKGMFNHKFIEKSFKPLLDSKNLPIDITLYDFYMYSKIELHFITFDINEYKVNDVSYLTYPQVKLVTALQMTCGLPLLVEPIIMEEKCFIDGGMACNYPLNLCIESKKEKAEILGFKNAYDGKKDIIKPDTSFAEYLFMFIFKAIFSINNDENQEKIPNEICLDTKRLSFETLNEAIGSKEKRRELFENGREKARLFLESF